MNEATAHRRTYLFALVDGGGTVPPEVGAARRLAARGHHVIVLADESMKDDVEASGATFVPWVQAPNRASRRPEDDPTRDWECSNPFQLFTRLLDQQFVGPAPGYAADVAAAIDEHRPDLVVCSFFAIGAMVAAEAAGVPFDVLFPNIYLLPTPGLPPVGLGLRPARGRPGRVRDRAVRRLTNRQWDKGLPRLNALRADVGLDPLDGFFEQVHRARRHLVMTSADFDFPADVPPRVRYVGAVLDDPEWAGTAGWTAPSDDRPLVLVALSTTFQDHAACLQRIVDGLGALPIHGLVTTGPALDPGALTAPPNVAVVRAAPHSQILARAAAVVTHGGHGTVVRALAAGVPMVVVPHGRDQADNAARIATRGAGVTVRRSASPRQVAAAVSRVLSEPSFASAADRLGRSIRRDAASGALIAELEDLPRSALRIR